MNSTSKLSTPPAGLEALLLSMSSMERFEEAVKQNRVDFNDAMQRRELAQARLAMILPPGMLWKSIDNPTLRQRRMVSAQARGKAPPPTLLPNRQRSIPVATLAQDQTEEWGEASVGTRLSQLLQAKVHDFPVESQRKVWQYGKRRGLINSDYIPYAKYMESQLAFIGPIPISQKDPPSLSRRESYVRTRMQFQDP